MSSTLCINKFVFAKHIRKKHKNLNIGINLHSTLIYYFVEVQFKTILVYINKIAKLM